MLYNRPVQIVEALSIMIMHAGLITPPRWLNQREWHRCGCRFHPSSVIV